MAGILDERERGYESKWAHEQDAHFAIMAQRNAWLGHWAAQLMKLSPDEADRYVEAVVAAGIAGKGIDPVFEKVRGDLIARGTSCTDSIIHRKMKEFYEQAEATIKKA